MPIRIREVHIKATVADAETAAKKEQKTTAATDKIDIQEVVALCVAQVMRQLKKMEER